jgi:hypothetical protein
MNREEFKVTHIIEILPCDILSHDIHNKSFEAMEVISDHGFYFFPPSSIGSSNGIASFIPSKFAKVIKEVKPFNRFPPLYLMGFFIAKTIKDPDLKIRLWVYKPKENITAYHLSLLLPYLMTSGSPVPLNEEELDLVIPFWKEYVTIQDLPKALHKSKEYEAIRKRL